MFGFRTSAAGSFHAGFIRQRWKRDTRSPYMRAGAIVMREGRKRIKRRKRGGASPPGASPYSRHTGGVRRGRMVPPHPLRLIFFEVYRGGVRIGPVGFGARKPVTELHEKGGARVVAARGRHGGKRAARYPRRPTMVPALKNVREKIVRSFHGTFRK